MNGSNRAYKGLADTTREFNRTAARRKQYRFEGDKLLYKGKEIGTWSPTSLRLIYLAGEKNQRPQAKTPWDSGSMRSRCDT